LSGPIREQEKTIYHQSTRKRNVIEKKSHGVAYKQSQSLLPIQ